MEFLGRKQIFTSESNFTDGNICPIISKAQTVHNRNRLEIQTLYDYYKGLQAIANRVKEVRPEINNKIVENHAAEIVNFKTGFTFGEPVQYVYRGNSQTEENSGDDNGIAILNQIMDEMNKAPKDRELAEWFYICGVAQRITLYEGGKLNTYVCDPRSTFVIYSNDYKREPLLACTYSEDDTIEGNPRKLCHVYSKNHYWEIEDGNKILKSQSIYTGIPIVEYRANPTRQGSFETVIPLIDALNNMASNRMDGIEQTIQSLIWFNNCEVTQEQFDELKDRGGIQTKSSPGLQANIQLLSTSVDQQQSQTFVDYLYERMLTIAAVPDRKASAGGNTGQALVIGQGWTMAESAAKAMELEFKASEKLFLENVLKIMKQVGGYTAELANLSVSDIDIKFTRNKTDNLLTKTQGLINQLEAGIHPRIAIANCGLYSDPEQTYLDSEPYLRKWLEAAENAHQTADNQTSSFDAELDAVIRKMGAGNETG